MLKFFLLIGLFLLSISSVQAVEISNTQSAISTGVSASNYGYSLGPGATEEKQVQVEKKLVEKSSPDPSPVLKVENSNFEAKGKVTAISGDNFDVEGITIIKSPNYLKSVSGNIELGKLVEVKGVLENGVRYAKEIRMEGSATPTPSRVPESKSTQNNPGPANSTSNPSQTVKPSAIPVQAASIKPNPSSVPNLVLGDSNIHFRNLLLNLNLQSPLFKKIISLTL